MAATRAVKTAARGRPEQPPASRAPHPIPPWLEVLGVLVVWGVFVAWVTRGGLVFAYDAFRDMAYAHGILSGALWSDPSLPGLPAWYPPGHPILMAATAVITHASVATVYGTSVYWLQWCLPVLVFVLVRSSLGRPTAWLALPFVLLGSEWWLTHAAMPMPSVQGIGFTLAALWAWTRQGAGGREALLAGLLAGLGLWTHVLNGAFAVGPILLHGLFGMGAGGREAPELRRARAIRAVTASGLALAVAAPVLARQFLMRRLNDAPTHWFAPGLHDPGFALQAHAPLVPLLGLIGLGFAAARWSQQGWLVVWFGLGLLGQLAGYAGHDAGWPIPWLIPHEFQWHAQLALCVAAAAAVVHLAERVPRGRRGLAAAAITVAALGPALGSLPRAGAYLVHAEPTLRGTMDVAAWIAEHVPADAVMVSDDESSYALAGLTGRKVVALPIGHMNPGIDPSPRREDQRVLMTTADEREFRTRAARYDAAVLVVRWRRAGADSLARRYAGWSCLEPVDVRDTGFGIYRIKLR